MSNLAIVNGNLITLDPDLPTAEAALVRHGRIAHVGTTADVQRAAGDTPVYDAGGRTVVPGFIEKEPGTPSSLTPEQWSKVASGIPMGRIGRRDEVAATIEFLLSKDAGYITGQAIHVNGGLTL